MALDSLRLADSRIVSGMLDKFAEGGIRETIVYSTNVVKLSEAGKRQNRALLVTNSAIYNLLDKTFKMKRRIQISHLNGILTTASGMFTLKVRGSYDYRFISSHQNTIVTIIAQKYSTVKRGEQLTIQGSMSSQDTETDEQKAQREAIEAMKTEKMKSDLRRRAEQLVAERSQNDKVQAVDPFGNDDYITVAEFNRRAERKRALQLEKLKQLAQGKDQKKGKKKNYVMKQHDGTFHEQLIHGHEKLMESEKARAKDATRVWREEREYELGRIKDSSEYDLLYEEKPQEPINYFFSTTLSDEDYDSQDSEDFSTDDESLDDEEAIAAEESNTAGLFEIPEGSDFAQSLIFINGLIEQMHKEGNLSEASRLRKIAEYMKEDRRNGHSFEIPDIRNPDVLKAAKERRRQARERRRIRREEYERKHDYDRIEAERQQLQQRYQGQTTGAGAGAGADGTAKPKSRLALKVKKNPKFGGAPKPVMPQQPAPAPPRDDDMQKIYDRGIEIMPAESDSEDEHAGSNSHSHRRNRKPKAKRSGGGGVRPYDPSLDELPPPPPPPLPEDGAEFAAFHGQSNANSAATRDMRASNVAYVQQPIRNELASSSAQLYDDDHAVSYAPPVRPQPQPWEQRSAAPSKAYQPRPVRADPRSQVREAPSGSPEPTLRGPTSPAYLQGQQAASKHRRRPSNGVYDNDGDEPEDYVVPRPELRKHVTPPEHELAKVSRSVSGKGKIFETKYRQKNLGKNMLAQMKERERAATARASAVSSATYGGLGGAPPS